jgi:hypothetical protein
MGSNAEDSPFFNDLFTFGYAFFYDTRPGHQTGQDFYGKSIDEAEKKLGRKLTKEEDGYLTRGWNQAREDNQVTSDEHKTIRIQMQYWRSLFKMQSAKESFREARQESSSDDFLLEKARVFHECKEEHEKVLAEMKEYGVEPD